ncbi:hypothetical protein HBHAL_2813 [Halobacillus halophilus DSM 2266]|uniref:Uncharacterized protein n=1 Tax=Halobacillus halophilus (strain ATCC 35676 / DSM 2266 / JCM 20832 / KCTC 3685 / LMG 17431 / NBRC 102448 / NCIMB 2269) TaxID=866895 RepID=I0JLZ1_HALH3|nr:hypothetical protein HBHAL_2813 [Halobacillus halophilus DSM 2266]
MLINNQFCNKKGEEHADERACVDFKDKLPFV